MVLKDKKTKITFYAGMRTIGGTYIEVRYENQRIIFDCGSIFDGTIEDENISLKEILDKELAPKINNFYDKNIIKFEKINLSTAVFVSHVHLDHTKMINFIDSSIPIYTSEDTKKLLESLNVKGDFIYKNNNIDKITRDIIGVDYDNIIKVGKIEVKFIRVDHDAYGACGFIIKTPDLKISYTGDIRLHGYLKDETMNFIEESKNSDYLICEGVSVSFDDRPRSIGKILDSEENLLQEVIGIVNENTDKLIFFKYYHANIERIEKMIENIDRKFVFSDFYAYILKNMLNIDLPYYKTSNIDFNLDDNLEIGFDEIKKNVNKYILQVDENIFDIFEEFKDYIGLYMHLDASPLGEFDPTFKPYFEEILKYNIIVKILKCSGHANPKDLQYIINQINAKVLVPIHSFKPELLYNVRGRLLPEKNEII